MKHHLDLRRLLCPMPVIKLQNNVKAAKAGDLFELVCTDPGVLQDIPAWCRINGHECLEMHEHDNEITLLVKVCEANNQ